MAGTTADIAEDTPPSGVISSAAAQCRRPVADWPPPDCHYDMPSCQREITITDFHGILLGASATGSAPPCAEMQALYYATGNRSPLPLPPTGGSSVEPRRY